VFLTDSEEKRTDDLVFDGQTGVTLTTFEITEVTSLEVVAVWPRGSLSEHQYEAKAVQVKVLKLSFLKI